MLGTTHELVANLAIACLNSNERMILYPQWRGVEAGATLSDHFRIMWEPIESGSTAKQLVHRCFVDSDKSKDHGCITRAWDHANGCLAFIADYMEGYLEGAYDEISFFENLGMFMGITSHHIADLCTPVHVGGKIDYKALGHTSLASLHKKVERDISRLSKREVKLCTPRRISLSKSYFWNIAQDVYSRFFVLLPEIYEKKNNDILVKMVSSVISLAVTHTADVWHTILTESKMVRSKWSLQPLI